MHRREFLQGMAGSVALGSVGMAGTTVGVDTTTSHPGPYSPLGSIPIENAKETVPDPNGDFAYVATTDGLAVVDVQIPRDPQLVFEERDLLADRETGPLRLLQDVKVEEDRLILAGPANPIRGDVLQGFVLYDVSDPANPSQIAFHETDFPIHNCFIQDGVAYLTGNGAETNALVMVDVSDGTPTEIGRWSLTSRDEAWSEVPSGLWTLHDVWVQDGLAYLSHWDAGTYIVNVSDPENPEFQSRVGGRPLEELREVPDDQIRTQVLSLPGNSHYAMASEDGSLLGINKEAWEAGGQGGPGGIELWDTSDTKNPEQLTTIEAPASSDPSIGGTWTTSHNFDIVDDRLFSSWYQGGVKIQDISDPANPEELAWWRKPGETSFWTAKRGTEEFFVASSMGRNSNGMGAFYTFPNHAGQQKDAPSLTATAEDGAGDGNENQSETESGSESTTTEQAAFSGDAETTDSGASSGSVPGLGIPAGIAALLGAGAWQKYRE